LAVAPDSSGQPNEGTSSGRFGFPARPEFARKWLMIVEFGASKSSRAAQPGSRARCLFGDPRRGGSLAKEPNRGH
jgi:hypothetical protein